MRQRKRKLEILNINLRYGDVDDDIVIMFVRRVEGRKRSLFVIGDG